MWVMTFIFLDHQKICWTRQIRTLSFYTDLGCLISRIFFNLFFSGSGGAGSGSGANIGGGGGQDGQHQDLGISSAFVGLHEGHKDSSTIALTPRESK